MDELELRLAARRTVELESQLRRGAEDIARTLQHSLLPARIPEIPGLDIAARYHVANADQVGGDFYDVIPDAAGGCAVVVGDACGKGTTAAALTGTARWVLRATVAETWTPAAALARLNTVMVRAQDGDGDYCTAALLAVAPVRDGQAAVTVGLAGHPHPLLVRADGSIERIGRTSPVVGWTLEASDRVECHRHEQRRRAGAVHRRNPGGGGRARRDRRPAGAGTVGPVGRTPGRGRGRGPGMRLSDRGRCGTTPPSWSSQSGERVRPRADRVRGPRRAATPTISGYWSAANWTSTGKANCAAASTPCSPIGHRRGWCSTSAGCNSWTPPVCGRSWTCRDRARSAGIPLTLAVTSGPVTRLLDVAGSPGLVPLRVTGDRPLPSAECCSPNPAPRGWSSPNHEAGETLRSSPLPTPVVMPVGAKGSWPTREWRVSR